MGASIPEGRAFFERQQRRRRLAQARLTNRPAKRRRPVPPASMTLPQLSVTAPPPPRILVISGPDTGQAFDLPPGELIIGREEGSAVRLTDVKVSHNHALLRVRGDQVTIEDLRSTNGTRVNGTRIERQTPLASGDEIDVGGVQLLLEIAADIL